MKTSRILFVLGTRSEAIKCLPVIRALEASRSGIEARIGATGQHGVLLQQILDLEGVRPAWNLEAMRPRQSAAALLGRLIRLLDSPLHQEKPDWVVALGDSASAVAAGIAARSNAIPFIHLEAGIRGGAPGRPYPQDAFRRMATAAAVAHAPPTEEARDNLAREGIPDGAIAAPADAGLDALAAQLRDPAPPEDPELAGLDDSAPTAVATLVRRESHQDPAIAICHGLTAAARRRPDLQIVFVNHLNPHLMEPVRSLLAGVPNLRVTLPLPHGAFAGLLRRADFVLTDSGGVLEEATALRIPVAYLSEARESGRALGAGPVHRVGAGQEAVESVVIDLTEAADRRGERPPRELPDFVPAAPRIAAQIMDWAARGAAALPAPS